MKDKLINKKLIPVYIAIVAVILIVIYALLNPHILSKNEIMEYVYEDKDVPSDFLQSDLAENIEQIKGVYPIRVEHLMHSANSLDEAMDIAYSFFGEDQKNNIEITLVSENKYYYLLNSKSILDYTPDNYYIFTIFKKDIFEVKTKTLYTKDTEDIKNILNTVYYIDSEGKIVSSKITNSKYSLYFIDVSYGDNNVKDEIYYKKIDVSLKNKDEQGNIVLDLPNADLLEGTLIRNISVNNNEK